MVGSYIYLISAHVLQKFGDRPCSSLMLLWTRGVQAGGERTLMPPQGRVQSSEEVLTRTCTVSRGGISPRCTSSTVLSRSSSTSTWPGPQGNNTSYQTILYWIYHIEDEMELYLSPWGNSGVYSINRSELKTGLTQGEIKTK